jgi:soluble lytic murein transglycosylase-like protein
MRLQFVVGIIGVVSVAAAASLPTARVRSTVKVDSKGRLVRAFIATVHIPEVQAGTTASSVRIDSTLAAIPELIEAAAKKYDVDPLLVASVISVESAFNPLAVSYKGAQGLMQLMPETARRFGVVNSFDVRENIEGGVRYLKYLDTLFPNNLPLRIAAYNAGEGAVWKYNNRIPPYAETIQYVKRVGERYDRALRKKKEQEVLEAGKRTPAEAVVADGAAIEEEEYASIQFFTDSEGRLHLRNAPSPSSSELGAP